MDNTNIKDTAVNAESPNIGKKINPVPKPDTNIGIDIDNEFYEILTNAGVANVIDITQFNNFSQLSQSRETLYHVLDTMAEDSTVAAMLETYAEDATEPNEQGKIVWAESSDAEVAKYIEFLLNSLNVNKNIYNWVYSLVKYGDLYLRLFRQSDFEDDLLTDKDKTPLNEKFSNINSESEPINENVYIKAYDKSDKLVNYIEAVPNPGEMFELTKFGKSYSYIKTNTTPTSMNKNQTLASSYYTYRFRRNDVQIFNAVAFTHASLQDDTSRAPEQVQLFRNDNELEDPDKSTAYTYSVRRGQSLLYNMYKVWRQMMLLENALLLNRLTKSSILRVIEVEVADMPKERVGPHLQRIKSLVEQKTSITDGNSMSEYTNPGAMENNIYVPTHNGVGAINTQQIGGDVNVRDIADIDYFKNKFYAASKIPKQFMGDTDDATGFNGGTSLSIVSSRYAKTIKRIQATMCQALTDTINILLIDRGLDNYVNKFSIHMQPPVTQEELDKRDNTSSKIQISDDVMRMVDGIEDEIIKLKILKALLSNAITNTEVIDLIQEQIDALELAQEEELNQDDNDDMNFGDDESFDFGDVGGGTSDNDLGGFEDNLDLGGDEEVGPESEEDTGEDTLPTPADLDAGDFSDMI